MNKIFNSTTLILTKQSMVKVLSDMAESNPNIACSVLSGKMYLYAERHIDFDSNESDDRICITVEDMQIRQRYMKIYNTGLNPCFTGIYSLSTEVVERKLFNFCDNSCIFIDTVEIK